MPKKTKGPQPIQPITLKGTIDGKNIVFNKQTFDGFVNFMSKLGIGANNQFSQGMYTFGPFLSRKRQELEASYRSSWVVGAVVDTIAEDMTRAGTEIVSNLEPDQITKINQAFERLQIWHELCSTIKWSRLFGGGLAVFLIDGQKPETPLKIETIQKGQFKGLLVMDRWLVDPTLGDVVKDLCPELGMPKYYQVVGDAAAIPNMKIHYSRVIRFDGIELPYYQKKAENMWGISVIERMHDRLIAFDSVTQGAAQLVFKAHLRGIGVKGLREALSLGGKAEETVIKQFEYIRLMQSNEGLTLLDSEDEFWTQQYTFSGLAEMILQFGEQISGATGIPLVRLFGQSPTGMNSTGESDLRNYYDNINKLQNNQIRGPLEKLYKIICASELDIPLPEDFVFNFNSLWQLKDAEKVDLAKNVGDSVNQSYNSGIIGRKTALQELKQSSRVTGIYSNITDEIINSAEEEPEKMGELGAMGGGFNAPGEEPGADKPKTKETKDAGTAPAYLGPQEDHKGRSIGTLYQDPVTGSSFLVKTGENIEQKQKEVWKLFGLNEQGIKE